jgi:guanylate kinase
MSSNIEAVLTGTLYIVSAASGTGKTSLVEQLLRAEQGIVTSISYTTRPKRPREQDSVHYNFVDEVTFHAMLENGAFLEHARVFDHYYATSEQWVLERLRAGTDVILEIDWQGAQQVRAKIAESIEIFILPPSPSALRARLQQRAQDNPQTIERRMADAVSEMSHFADFDYLVINDDFDTALAELRLIVQAARLRCHIQAQRQRSLLSNLLGEP